MLCPALFSSVLCGPSCFVATASGPLTVRSRKPRLMKTRTGRDQLLWHRESSFSIPLSIGLLQPGITYPTLPSLRSPKPTFPPRLRSPYPICSPLHVAARSNEVQMAFPTWWPRADSCCCSVHSLQIPGLPLCPVLCRFPAASAREFIKDFIKLLCPSLQTVSLSDEKKTKTQDPKSRGKSCML